MMSESFPTLTKLATMCHEDPEGLVEELVASPIAAIAQEVEVPAVRRTLAATDNLPIVAAHGMGDSCFNSGMKSVTEAAGAEMGVYSVRQSSAQPHPLPT